MIHKLQRAAALVLALILSATLGLYALANGERIGAFAATAGGWFSARAMAAFEGPPEAPVTADSPAPAEEEILPPPQIPLAAPMMAKAATPEIPADHGPLPAFILADMLALVESECDQVLYLLTGGGTEGNLWLAVRRDGVWRNAMGPIYCRIGAEGALWDIAPGTAATPMGWMRPGVIYAGGPVTTAWAVEAASEGDRWDTNPQSHTYNTLAHGSEGLALNGPALDLGYNPGGSAGLGAGILLCGSDDLSAPTGGGVAVKPEHLRRLLSLLDPALSTAVGIFPGVAAGWQIDPGVPEDFVSVCEAVPGARALARYATDDNFMGRPLDGYQGLDVYIRRELAAGLIKAQTALEKQGLGLLFYDGYRPDRAVQDIFRWLRSEEEGKKEQFYPELDKSDLPGVYLAENSPHRQGIAVDVTLCDLETGCPLDMGTGFDFFSSKSWVSSRDLTPEQLENRKTLQRAMHTAGFSIYSLEWWHFNYMGYVPNQTARDFVVPQ